MGAKAIFAENLRKARKAAGLKQDALAFKAGIGRSYMSDLECARRSPSVEMIARLARALQVDAAVLVEGIPERISDDAFEQES